MLSTITLISFLIWIISAFTASMLFTDEQKEIVDLNKYCEEEIEIPYTILQEFFIGLGSLSFLIFMSVGTGSAVMYLIG